MIPIDLSGKTVLVTGATGQLGRVMVRTLADAGADVAIHYLYSATKAQELVDDVTAKGARAIAVQADITVKADVEAMRDTVTTALGSPHIIVNNAVIQYDWVNVLDQDEADYESQFRSCVLHNVLMAKTFVPAMIERRWGRVIAINTECTMQAWPNQSAYISGKAGQDRVLRVLAKEIGGHGITVNQTGQERQPAYEENVPLKRRGTDQEIANAVIFLASDLSSFITGAYIPVCGGNVMPCI